MKTPNFKKAKQIFALFALTGALMAIAPHTAYASPTDYPTGENGEDPHKMLELMGLTELTKLVDCLAIYNSCLARGGSAGGEFGCKAQYTFCIEHGGKAAPPGTF